LKINRKAMNKETTETPSAVVEVIEGGPLKITGNILFRDIRKHITDYPGEVYLCRCGRSCGKPFCDGSHKK